MIPSDECRPLDGLADHTFELHGTAGGHVDLSVAVDVDAGDDDGQVEESVHLRYGGDLTFVSACIVFLNVSVCEKRRDFYPFLCTSDRPDKKEKGFRFRGVGVGKKGINFFFFLFSSIPKAENILCQRRNKTNKAFIRSKVDTFYNEVDAFVFCVCFCEIFFYRLLF